MKTNRLGAAAAFCVAFSLNAQTQTTYTGTNVTGALVLTRVVNPSQLGASRILTMRQTQAVSVDAESDATPDIFQEVPRILRRLHPQMMENDVTAETLKAALSSRAAFGLPSVNGLLISNASTFGFNGLRHLDQLNANNGNQYNSEPPNPAIAVANGFVLLGVNNAIQVYNLTGTPLLPRVLASNELFGVSPAIIRSTGVNGVYPTDMRVFYDQGMNRFFVLQRAQDYNTAGDPIPSSHLYMAVSQTPDPTGGYNVYVMNTTDPANPSCPCVADYPSIGADQYGFHISTNEFTIAGESFVNAQVHSVSKASLLAGITLPVLFRVKLPFTTGYEFAIHPATTPPGASYYTANGGLQYFVSTVGNSTSGNRLAVYALSNTASLATASPNLSMVQIAVQIVNYSTPNIATQKPGPLSYGSTVGALLPYIDGGDNRIQAVTYAGGRIYTTFATALNDDDGNEVVGGAFVVLSPTYRGGLVSAPLLRQGYFLVRGNHLLRPAIGVNAAGHGAIAATLVGPGYFPSSVYLPFETFSGPSSVMLAASGSAPEDGFTAYSGGANPGLARWGDYSSPFVAPDGSLWMAVEYIPNLPRSQYANWGVFVSKY